MSVNSVQIIFMNVDLLPLLTVSTSIFKAEVFYELLIVLLLISPMVIPIGVTAEMKGPFQF